MLKSLKLNNLILVESTEIAFGPHFNVITGETGAGKTALLEAIYLCLGARADSSLIRKGCDRAFAEIRFCIANLPKIQSLLHDSGLDPLEEELLIRRELTKEGKNRSFINCQTVPLPLLQKIGAELIDFIDQNAQQSLRKTEFQRTILDLFAGTEKQLETFQLNFETTKTLEKKLHTLEELSLKREREEDVLRFQIEEIEKVSLKQGEEDSLFEQYKRLANSQEIGSKIAILIDQISEGSDALIPKLSYLQKTADSLLKCDGSIEAPLQLLRQATVFLNEALHTFQSYQNTLDEDPKTLDFLEARLSDITRLKRKYGNTFEEIDAFYKTCQQKFSSLSLLEEEIESTQIALTTAQTATTEAAEILSATRKAAAHTLQTLLTTHLRALNMPGAEVVIEILPQARHLFGEDLIQFWIRANAGEHPALVKEHSSGGEVSRLLFAIKLALAEKNNTPTLLFDEIDANVGGETASIIGEKLRELGTFRQVLCITHFPQVASFSNDHFSVQKVEKNGRTLTEIHALDPNTKAQELLRMLGGKNLFPTF